MEVGADLPEGQTPDELSRDIRRFSGIEVLSFANDFHRDNFGKEYLNCCHTLFLYIMLTRALL